MGIDDANVNQTSIGNSVMQTSMDLLNVNELRESSEKYIEEELAKIMSPTLLNVVWLVILYLVALK